MRTSLTWTENRERPSLLEHKKGKSGRRYVQRDRWYHIIGPYGPRYRVWSLDCILKGMAVGSDAMWFASSEDLWPLCGEMTMWGMSGSRQSTWEVGGGGKWWIVCWTRWWRWRWRYENMEQIPIPERLDQIPSPIPSNPRLLQIVWFCDSQVQDLTPQGWVPLCIWPLFLEQSGTRMKPHDPSSSLSSKPESLLVIDSSCHQCHDCNLRLPTRVGKKYIFTYLFTECGKQNNSTPKISTSWFPEPVIT